MKVTGFSFIRNAEKYQYPIKEALQSILPLCDEIVVAVGQSEDNTRDLVAAVHPHKIKILDTTWDETLLTGGKVLAVETDKAFRTISPESDWCFYIQGDEVVHEEGYEEIYNAMKRWKEDERVDGLLFKYRHFYGSFNYVGASSRWYRHEIRIIKNDKNIYSYRDAQGFRKGDNQKLQVKPLHAYIHHYGWVREPKTMQQRNVNFSRYWKGSGWEADKKLYSGAFDYSGIDALEKFTGTHPQVMQQRIQSINWQFDYDLSYNRIRLKDRFKHVVEKITGKRPFDHNNFIIV